MLLHRRHFVGALAGVTLAGGTRAQTAPRLVFTAIPDQDETRLVERFTPVGADRIEYQGTVEDPAKFSRPWTIAIPMVRDDDYRIFEYACHEGNHAMTHILSGARAADAPPSR